MIDAADSGERFKDAWHAPYSVSIRMMYCLLADTVGSDNLWISVVLVPGRSSTYTPYSLQSTDVAVAGLAIV